MASSLPDPITQQGKNKILHTADPESPRWVVQFDETRVIVHEEPVVTTKKLSFSDTVLSGDSEMLIDGKKANTFGSFPIPLSEPHWAFANGVGNYFPASSSAGLELVGERLYFSRNSSLASPGGLLYFYFEKTSPAQMQAFLEQMTVPFLAPFQVTQNDDEACIVYDKNSRTTAYLIHQPNLRMSSVGYLNGCDKPCAILIHSSGKTLSISAGMKSPAETLRLKLFGDWQPAPGRNAVTKVEHRAGRTWIEFSAGLAGTGPINLIEMPSKGFVKRLLEWIEKP